MKAKRGVGLAITVMLDEEEIAFAQQLSHDYQDYGANLSFMDVIHAGLAQLMKQTNWQSNARDHGVVGYAELLDNITEAGQKRSKES